MDMLAGIEASFSGLEAQRIRMNVIAANLANAQTTRTPEGGPYKRPADIRLCPPDFRLRPPNYAATGGRDWLGTPSPPHIYSAARRAFGSVGVITTSSGVSGHESSVGPASS